MSENTSTTTDIQDPLPEANWLWRRVFIFTSTAAVLYFIYGSVDRLSTVAVVRPDIGIPAFVSIVKLLVITVWILCTYYMVAPSAEQITKMMQTAGLLKAGVQIASRTVETAEKRETATTVAQPPQPVSPPIDSPPDARQPQPEPDMGAGTGFSGPSATETGPEGPDLPLGLLPASMGLETDRITKGVGA